ncbi:unnamed protein product [Blepharisma stoltei]|uniref:Uncharacterized protein n=1 Tax=Blepharisma stoltei TaxID=1481888 RepID=A0AAU9K537_9CILI|nr:unnamed protein product [Blepharisma stoltei]
MGNYWIFGVIDRASLRFRMLFAGNDRTWNQLSYLIQLAIYNYPKIPQNFFSSDGWAPYKKNSNIRI